MSPATTWSPAAFRPAGARRRFLLSALWASLCLAATASAATITVNTTADELDLFANATCSLREAVVSINEGRDVGGCDSSGSYGSNDRIELPSGTYRLTRTGLFDGNDQDKGNLNLLEDMTIDGAGARQTTIDGEAIQFFNNGTSSYGQGGVIAVASGRSVTISDLAVRNGGAYEGGGIHNAGNLTLLRVRVHGNRARGGLGGSGGGIYSRGTLEVIASTIDDNETDEYGMGGGLHQYGGTVLVENSTISGNLAETGGGIANLSGVLSLSSVTITANGNGVNNVFVGGLTGGLYVTGTTHVENTIIAGNGGSGTASPDCWGEVDSLGYNLVGDESDCDGFDRISDKTGTAAQPLDARLGALSNHGGATNTHALLSGSPAIDGGPLGILDSCLESDQRGESRPRDGDGNGFLQCDIGAFEAPTVVIPPPASADLLFSVVAPATVEAGAEFDYTLYTRNNGPDTATGVTVVDELPESLTFVSASPQCSRSGRVVTCLAGSLERTELSTLTITVRAPLADASITNSATVTADTNDPDSSSNAASVTTTVELPQNEVGADLFVNLNGPSTVQAGTEFTYSLILHNNGPDAAQSVFARLSLPSGVSFVSGPEECDDQGSSVVCLLGTMEAFGSTLMLPIRVTAPPTPRTISATATISGVTEDPFAANDTALHSLTVTEAPPPPGADLSLVKTAPAVVATGAQFVYSLIVQNDGPDGATAVTLSDELPSGLAIVSLPPGCSEVGSGIECSLGTIDAGANRLVEIEVTAPDSTGEIVNTAQAASATDDPDASDNEDSVTTNVTEEGAQVPQLEVAAGAQSPSDFTTSGTEDRLTVLQLALRASASENLRLGGLTLDVAVNGAGAAALDTVELFVDSDGDGSSQGESLLASAPLGSGGEVQLDAQTILPAGSERHLLVSLRNSELAGTGSWTVLSLGLALGVLTTILNCLGRVGRRLARTVAPLLLAAILAACSGGSVETPQSTVSVTVTQVSATGTTSSLPASVAGLPLAGAEVTIR